MKYKLITILLFNSIIGLTQSLNIEEKGRIKFEPFTIRNLPSTESLVTENGFYFLETIRKRKGKGYKLIKYNSNLELLNSTRINVPFNSKKNKIIHFTFSKNKILVFDSFIEKKKKTKSIIMYSFDASSLEEIDKPKVIYESNYKGFTKKENKYYFSKSPNSKLLLICEINNKPEQEREIGLIILDKETGDIIIEKTKGGFGAYSMIQNVLITDLGEIYILRKRFNPTEVHNIYYSGHHRKIEYYIHRITAKSKIQIKLSLEKSVRELHMNLNLNQLPFLMGFDFKKKYVGLVLIQIDLENFESENFTYDYINCTANNSYAALLNKPKKDRNHTRTMRPRNIFQKPNGNFVIIGEEGYRTVWGDSHQNHSYYHNNIIISEHQKDGEIIWSHLIKKYGNTTEDSPRDFFLFKSKNDLYLIFNNNNSKQKLILTSIDKNGNIKVNPFSNNVYQTFPNKNMIISEKEFLLLLRNKKYELELAKFKVK
ncbi:MAG: hypothetical protein AB8H03_12820 [Saprospiraceae bacterium]